MKTVTTPKGTALPLANLKGKDYLMVAHRLQWFNETESNFRIETDFLLVNDDQTVARAVVTVFDKEGKEIKRASATKRETKKDFPDHTEIAWMGLLNCRINELEKRYEVQSTTRRLLHGFSKNFHCNTDRGI